LPPAAGAFRRERCPQTTARRGVQFIVHIICLVRRRRPDDELVLFCSPGRYRGRGTAEAGRGCSGKWCSVTQRAGGGVAGVHGEVAGECTGIVGGR